MYEAKISVELDASTPEEAAHMLRALVSESSVDLFYDVRDTGNTGRKLVVRIEPKHERHVMLALSCLHVSRETGEQLNEEEHLSYRKGMHGWFVPVMEKELEGQDMPEDLRALTEYARANCYTWLMFDYDCEQVEGLPVFDWRETVEE